MIEGSGCFEANCSTKGTVLPVVQYPRSQGNSITGGHVYRGKNHKLLVGLYVYADFTSGKVWGAAADPKAPITLLCETSLNISSFGLDSRKELLMLDHTSGHLMRLEPTP
jgi:hypothetical protein